MECNMAKGPLKMIYITDLHEAVKEIRYLFQMTEADIYIVSGDLLYRAFYSYENIYEFISLQEEFHHLRLLEKLNGQETTPFDLANKVIQNSWLPSQEKDLWQRRSERYLFLYNKAFQTMLEKYNILEELFRKYVHVPIYVIPGNYDMDLDKTPLKYRNVHKKSVPFEGYKISGFGGADVLTLGIPEKLIVEYREKESSNETYSEAVNFFQKEQPNIMLLHKPVYGHWDNLGSKGNSGSIPLARFIEDNAVKLNLVLSGHMHEARGAKDKEGVVYLNPGNFGRTLQIHGLSDGGFFAEIYLARDPQSQDFRDTVRRIKRMGISKGKIQELEENTYFNDSIFSGKFGLFSELKTYFRQFETAHTKHRVRDFMRIARYIQRNGENIAFDLLGSVNFGMSEEESDVDMVMYHMCSNVSGSCDMASCPKAKHYEEILLQNLLQKFANHDYPLEVIDCLNLNKVEQAIENGDPEDDALIRYIFYRKLGRPINKRLLRPIDDKIAAKHDLQDAVEQNLDDLIEGVSENQTQKLSLEKYKVRLSNMGVFLPKVVREKILYYLGHKN